MATVLHEDVLRLIFANVSTGDRQDVLTLSRLALVSRQFYNLVTPLLYRSLHFESHYQSQKRNLEVLMIRLTTKTEVIGFVREIHIGEMRCQRELVVDWLKDLIPRLTLLNAFHWNAREEAILPVVRLIRQLWPSCQLYPKHLDIGSPEAHELVEMILQMVQEIQFFFSHEPFLEREQKRAFVHAIKKCPNVRSLEIRQSPSGCIIYAHHWNEPQVRLDLSEGDILPAPFELKMLDPPFLWEDIGYWGDIGGWINLEKLTLRDTSPLPFFRGCSTTLRSLSLIDGRRIDEVALDAFCANLRGLHKLEIVGRSARIPTNILRKHGEALKQLEVHGYKTQAPSNTQTSIADCDKPSNSLELDRWCPNLSHITLDMFRDGESWPYVFLSTIARCPKLTTLTLYVLDIAVSPHLDKPAAEHIFSYLSSRKTGFILEELNIHHVSTKFYGGMNVDPGHTVFACMADPLTDELIIEETKRGGTAEMRRLMREPNAHTERMAKEHSWRLFYAHPPSVFLAEVKAYNACLQSLAPDRPELHVVHQDYEIRTCNDPDRLLLYEEEWNPRDTDYSTIDIMEMNGQPSFDSQMQDLSQRQDEKTNDGLERLSKSLRQELDRRVQKGWNLWEMEGVGPKWGSEGFLFDKMSA